MLIFLVFHFVEAIFACIPTQETEPITPKCSSCSPVYETGCMGYNMPTTTDWCAIVTVTYTYTPGLPEDMCTANVICPAGTKPQYLSDNGYGMTAYVDGDNGAISCDETGYAIGQWGASIGGSEDTFTKMRCQVV
ncbi:CW domain-containing protein [Caenorhabditis elegans]|uniref:CW domain-containing protein n=1 Tax=Caenorhabditis elegans TaxID=6239 RepID=Q9XV20_CAEEL|nr:CW domain-containing protein [Caenorhabditis elegans]CAB04399.1 CW domain-containing protein [Caenorhabditis elegans]|eukprot:NP_507979.1 Uncharacterized protein CELE_F46B3.8 [Caenorhabditis elegans]